MLHHRLLVSVRQARRVSRILLTLRRTSDLAGLKASNISWDNAKSIDSPHIGLTLQFRKTNPYDLKKANDYKLYSPTEEEEKPVDVRQALLRWKDFWEHQSRCKLEGDAYIFCAISPSGKLKV